MKYDILYFDVKASPKWGELISEHEEKLKQIKDEYFSHIVKDQDVMTDVLGDVYWPLKAKEGPKDWSPKKKYIGEAGLSILLENVGRLESYSRLVSDAIHFMVESAAMPRFSDVDWAFHRARTEVSEKGEIDWDLWDPIAGEDYKWKTGRGILDDFLSTCRMDQYPDGTYMMKLSVLGSAPANTLFSTAPKEDKEAVKDGLRREAKAVFDRIISRFWQRLEDDVSQTDIEVRTDWRNHWKEALADKERVKEAQDEMLEFLKARKK